MPNQPKGIEELADEIKNLHAEVFAGTLSPLYVDKKVVKALTAAYELGGRDMKDRMFKIGLSDIDPK